MTLVCVAVSQAASGQTADVPRELWDRPRTGQAVLEQQDVRGVVAAALAKPGSQIVIHHGESQESLVQAEELKSWLGALAIDTRRVALRNDLGAAAPLRIEIVQ